MASLERCFTRGSWFVARGPPFGALREPLHTCTRIDIESRVCGRAGESCFAISAGRSCKPDRRTAMRCGKAVTGPTGVAAQSGARACEAGRDSVDGLLGIASGGRSDHSAGRRSSWCCGSGQIPNGPPPELMVWLRPLVTHRWMVHPGKGGGRVFRGLGLAAARRLGAHVRAGDGVSRVAECSDRDGARNLYAMGAAALAVR